MVRLGRQEGQIVPLPQNAPSEISSSSSRSSNPLNSSPNLVHALPPLPPPPVSISKPISCGHLTRKLGPTIPVRRSSLDRPSASNNQNSLARNTKQTMEPDLRHAVVRSPDGSHADYLNEPKTPTNERISIVDGKARTVLKIINTNILI